MGEGGLDLLAPLSTIFARVYAARRPRRLAVLGVATGNGLDHVSPIITGRVVGVDLNLSYLAVARQRFMRLGATLELLHGDLEKVDLPPRGFDLVHAALVLEYVDGPSLGSTLHELRKRGERLSIPEVAHIAVEISRGIARFNPPSPLSRKIRAMRSRCPVISDAS